MSTAEEIESAAAALHAMTAPELIEQRSVENPALAVSPALLDGLWGYGPTRSGVQINEDTSLTFTAVFAAVKVLSESIGMLPLAVYAGDDDNDVRVRAKDHSAYKLLRWSPNEEMTAAVFKESVQANLSLWGRGFARIEVNGRDEPVAIRPIQSSQVAVERVAGEVRYRVRNGQGGTFAPEEMISIPAMSLNGLVGLSPIAYCREAVATGKAAEIFGSTFFGNGANVRGVLTVPTALTPAQTLQLRESWDAMYAGVGNANKTGVVPFGGKYEKIGVPPDEAQFLETRRFSVEEIARIYRIPPHMLGDLSRSTNSNIEQQSLEFLIYTLLPWIEKWEQELTRKLCGTNGDYHVKFDTNRMLRTNLASRMAYYQSGLQWGYLNTDEVRADDGRGQLPDKQGQVFRTPVNMEPMEILAKMAATGYRPTAAGSGGTPPAPPSPVSSGVRDLRPVLVDALSRMHRKEINAITRGTADQAFYETHRAHVREAITPFLSVVMSRGIKIDHAAAAILSVASAKHGGDPSVTAETDADQIIQALEDSHD